MKHRLSSTAIAVVAALTLAACGSGDGGTDSTADGADTGAASGEALKIGIKFDQPGLGLKEGDEYTGLDVDVAKYVANELGTAPEDIQWIQSPSAQRETLIETGQVDMIFATYSITDARKEKVSFAGPYFVAGQDLLVRSDDSAITGPDSLEGKSLCSVTGSTSAQKVKDAVPGVNLQEFGTYSECVAALVAGGVDAVTTDDTILAGYAAQAQYAGKLKVVGNTFSEENYGVGIKKGDVELCESINAALVKMVEDGSWEKAVADNLGAADYEAGPGNPPTPADCS